MKSFFMMGLIMLLSFVIQPVFAESNPPPKVLDSLTGKPGNGHDETPGEWYVGKTPENIKEDAPVLLFVPGMNTRAQIWWEENDMANKAYEKGYQTAFIQLYDAGGEAANMWDNGQLLAEKIPEISAHFNGKPITIIAYSKGGVDAQTAIVYYGASSYVKNVITLGTPHHGTPLADLAYSYWAEWLADLIGAKSDGTYSMQTGYMEEFRHEIDAHEKAYVNSYYTVAGTNWGKAFSATWFGGMYLSSYGKNDGVVPTFSSKLPKGTEIAVRNDWHHRNIYKGATFPVFESFINKKKTNKQHVNVTDSFQENMPQTNQFIRGGAYVGPMKEITIPIENGVKEVAISLLTSSALQDLVVINPSGKQIDTEIQSNTQNHPFFRNANQSTIHFTKPLKGEWTIRFSLQEKGAYMSVTNFHTDEKFSVQPSSIHKNKKVYDIQLDKNQIQEDSLKATYYIVNTKTGKTVQQYEVKGKKALSHQLNVAEKDVVFNITIDIEARTKDGEKVKRTMIDSVYNGK